MAQFEGVNRKAEVFLNGRRLGQLDGFMDRGRFDVTGILQDGKPNVLGLAGKLARYADRQLFQSYLHFQRQLGTGCRCARHSIWGSRMTCSSAAPHR